MSERDAAPPVLISGPDDPRLDDIDAGFEDVLGDLSHLVVGSRATRRRMLHTNATAVGGTLRVSGANEGLPASDVFRPRRELDVLVRFSNAFGDDDAVPGVRGASLRILDPAAGPGPAAERPGLLDLPMATGRCFFAPTAAAFAAHSGSNATADDRAAFAARYPHARGVQWENHRLPGDFAGYQYHSQAPRGYRDSHGRVWLVRYRLAAPGVSAGATRCPTRPDADPGDVVQRAPDDPRSATFMHDALRDRVAGRGVRMDLEIQVRPPGGPGDARAAALDASLPWPEDRYPWRPLARLHLTQLLDGHAAERVRFDLATAPEELGIVAARSAHGHASLNHLRALLYRRASAARTGSGQPAPARVVSARPRSPRRRVAVVGAGPAGLVFAREAQRLGNDVTVLEARPDVGGKCASVDIGGHAHDLGGHVCTSAYHTVAALVSEVGVDTEDVVAASVYDLARDASPPQDTAFYRPEVYQRYAALREAEFPRVGDAALGPGARALARPVGEWLTAHDLDAMATSFTDLYTGAGYGHLSGDLPALYFVKYVETTGLLRTGPGLLGHAGNFTVAGGFGRLWRAIAERLPDVRCDTRILSITRSQAGVAIRTSSGPVEADALVVATPLDQVRDVLDTTEDENDVAERVRYLDYRTTVISAAGLPRSGFHLVRPHTESPSHDGHCVAFHHRYPDSDVYACYSYGAADDHEDTLRADVARAGGRVTAVHLDRRWSFMPHFRCADLADGIYDRLDGLQGRNRTYHVGSLLSFELLEPTVAYARDLAARFFGSPDTGDGGAGERTLRDHGAGTPRQGTPAGRPSVTGGPSPGELRKWLRERAAAEVGRDPTGVDPDAPLDTLGLSSLSTARVYADLADLLGYPVPPTLFAELTTIEEVAARLGGSGDAHVAPGPPGGTTTSPRGERPSDPSGGLVTLTEPTPFFCFPGIGSTAHHLLPLARELSPQRPFHAPGTVVRPDQVPDASVEAIAESHLKDIQRTRPLGPYRLGGHSFGGLVAYEVGRQLRARGERVERIILLDSHLPVPDQAPPVRDDDASLRELVALRRATRADDEASPSETSPEHLVAMLPAYHACLHALATYRAGPSDLDVVLVRAQGGFPQQESAPTPPRVALASTPANGWDRARPGAVRVVPVPGDHLGMLGPRQVGATAEVVSALLG